MIERSAERRLFGYISQSRQLSHGRRRSRRFQLPGCRWSRAVSHDSARAGVSFPLQLCLVQVLVADPSRTPSGKLQSASAGPPTGESTARAYYENDDDSRFRFAAYPLSKPEQSRRGRPSSPCPAVAGAKPRDDGLRVTSRLPPRSRLGTFTKGSRQVCFTDRRTECRIGGPEHMRLDNTSLTPRRACAIVTRGDHRRVSCRRTPVRPRILTMNRGRSCSWSLADSVVRSPTASVRQLAGRRSDARVSAGLERVEVRS